MSKNNYDPNSVDSIVDFSAQLEGKSLNDVVKLPSNIINKKNKGDLGTLLEKYFYKHRPPNNHEPDFPSAVKVLDDELGKRDYKGLELKTTGVLKSKKGIYRAKERLVLTMINYSDIVKENWVGSTLRKKCRLMLILFYIYEKDIDVIFRRFIFKPFLYELEFPDTDLKQIKEDWETIRKKIDDGKAHELSEGDTFYLGACRKGQGGASEKLVVQPNSSIKAKSRAFSFKPNYLNIILNRAYSHTETQPEFDFLGVSEELTFADATELKFKTYAGKTTTEISKLLSHPYKGKNHKLYWRELAVKILSRNSLKIAELDKADIEMKTIRLKSSGTPRESMSFPHFKFKDLALEEWENSKFCEKLESKFLFVIFKEDTDGIERLHKVAYWNMPYEDRLEAFKVWETTKKLVKSNQTNFPKSKDNEVAHVRPKAKDGKSKNELPNGSLFLTQCFWLNSKYIKKVVETL